MYSRLVLNALEAEVLEKHGHKLPCPPPCEEHTCRTIPESLAFRRTPPPRAEPNPKRRGVGGAQDIVIVMYNTYCATDCVYISVMSTGRMKKIIKVC